MEKAERRAAARIRLPRARTAQFVARLVLASISSVDGGVVVILVKLRARRRASAAAAAAFWFAPKPRATSLARRSCLERAKQPAARSRGRGPRRRGGGDRRRQRRSRRARPRARRWRFRSPPSAAPLCRVEARSGAACSRLVIASRGDAGGAAAIVARRRARAMLTASASASASAPMAREPVRRGRSRRNRALRRRPSATAATPASPSALPPSSKEVSGGACASESMPPQQPALRLAAGRSRGGRVFRTREPQRSATSSASTPRWSCSSANKALEGARAVRRRVVRHHRARCVCRARSSARAQPSGGCTGSPESPVRPARASSTARSRCALFTPALSTSSCFAPRRGLVCSSRGAYSATRRVPRRRSKRRVGIRQRRRVRARAQFRRARNEPWTALIQRCSGPAAVPRVVPSAVQRQVLGSRPATQVCV